MRPLDLETARHILDLSGGQDELKALGETQLKGAVALYNMIADTDIGMGYLADEVGMGKTYIALAVVALMRYFDPTLRVLYICPSRNVQEKWDREYRSFTKHNVRVSQNRIRTIDGKPAAPYVSCKNVVEMIEMAASGYYADFFVGKGNFSISMKEYQQDDERYWTDKRDEILQLVPAHQWETDFSSPSDIKDSVKYEYAKALNYVLPTFDLVVIDEAHNFKHNFDSSARNRVLSRVLGFNEQDNYQPRVRHSLLLSATPYDRDLNQLRNQLNLVGKRHLLPEDVKEPEEIKNTLQRFMVRRLNTLNINGKEHTRNMYRVEHRKGEKAEIILSSDEQKLVTALVQKKVGDLMNQEGASPSFQTGMLSSFESYAQTSKAETIKFDGDDADLQHKDAEDRHIIDHLVESYKEAGLGLTLPHPKMDSVCRDLSKKLFNQAQKQLIFVRRVRSVKEIKDKLDDAYTQWLEKYINSCLKGYSQQQTVFSNLFDEYKSQSRVKDTDISEGLFHEGKEEGEQEDRQPPKNDTFFTWFFRGASADNVSQILAIDKQSLTSPEAIRKGLSSKRQQISLLFEINWAYIICKRHGHDFGPLIKQHAGDIALCARKYHAGILVVDVQDIFRACQLGFIEWFSGKYGKHQCMEIVNFLKPSILNQSDKEFTQDDVSENLQLITFFTEISRLDMDKTLFPLIDELFKSWDSNSEETILLNNKPLLEKINIHWHLISLCLRTGHGVIDLYLSRIKLGAGDLDKEKRTQWITDLVSSIKSQASRESLSTYNELYQTAEQLDLIIKNNIADITTVSLESRRRELSQWLNPVSPVIGATGETYSSRSAQARKFRMPGYPLALVTTDVLQEGEDLHTFCDSVLHYGITGSPVSIEQKIGRVDRVFSKAQRRLQKIESPVVTDDLIQVSFPHIKESIEFLQVRKLCQNLNEYTVSLHEIGTEINTSEQQSISPYQELLDRSETPEQIMTFLRSPFVPEVPINSVYTQEYIGQIEKSGNDVIEIKDHVNGLIDKHYEKLGGTEQADITISISSTRSIGEMLIVGSVESGEFHLRDDNLSKAMIENSWQTFHRIQAEKTGADVYKLTKNSEMLIGNKRVTQAEDIDHFFDTFSESHHPQYSILSSEKIRAYCKQAQHNGISLNNKKISVDIKYFDEDEGQVLLFEFGRESLQRKHLVQIYESDGYCIFVSKAINAEKLNSFDKEKDRIIIENTWARNNQVDLVEFLLDRERGISGRVIHPINSLDWEEFSLCTYLLAVETDRLEYIFNHHDVF